MAWTTITVENVKTRLTGAELTALQSSALASGQSDPLPEICVQVVDEVRGYIAAGGFALETGTTVPSKLLGASLAIIRYRLATRLPVKSLLDDNRVKENEAAIRLLESVAARRFLIEEPTTASTEAIGGPVPSMSAKTRTYKRTDQDGI
jgi:hypothetical protein